MPWLLEDDVTTAEAPDVASAGSVTGVRGFLDTTLERPIDSAAEHEIKQVVFKCKPGALGELAIDQIVEVNGVRYHYAGEAAHGSSVFQHLLLIREVA